MIWRKLIPAVLLIGGVIFFFIRPTHTPAAANNRRQVPLALARKSDFYIDLRTTGILEAANSMIIISELDGYNLIIWTADNGAKVKAGEAVIRLASSDIEEQIRQLTDELVVADQAVRSAQESTDTALITPQAAQTKAEEALKLTLNQNKAAVDKAKRELAFQEMELEASQANLAKQKRLLEEHLISRIELETAEDALRAQEFSLEKARRALTNAEKNASVSENLRQLDLERAKQDLIVTEATQKAIVDAAQEAWQKKQDELSVAEDNLAKTEIRAPCDGLLFLEPIEAGRLANSGPVRAGIIMKDHFPLARIIIPGKMRVACNLNDIEIEQIEPKQTALVEIPALPGVKMPGIIKEIDNVARESNFLEGGIPGRKIFTVKMDLNAKDKRLHPGVTAFVTIHLQHINQGVMVPVTAVFQKKKGLVSYKMTDKGFQTVPITLIARNETLAAIEGKIRPGDRLATTLPSFTVRLEGKKQ